jgi:hypothetical protein
MRQEEIIRRLRRRSHSRHTVDIGLRTEAVITSELLRRGVRVLTSCGFNHRYDLVLHCPDTDEIYAVPVTDAPKRSVTIRVDPTANSQAKGVRWASDYVLPA